MRVDTGYRPLPMITPINAFSVLSQSEKVVNDPYQVPRATVLREGRAIGLTIDGVTLEAQFAVNAEWYLLLLSDDSPYEEILHAYLLDPNFRVVDYAQLGYAYTSGILRDIQVVADDALTFAFTGSLRFRLTVYSEPRYLWNASGGAREILRFFSRRRLKIRQEVTNARQEIR